MKESYILQGYHPAFRKDRADGISGGGVMLLVRDNLQVTECVELNSSPFAEAVWCFVNVSKSKRLLVGTCYRSPNSTQENNSNMIEMLMKTRSIRADGLLIMGDFNYASIDWEEGVVNDAETSEAAKFFDATQDLFLYQHVLFPTRFREGYNPSLLDLIFSNEQHAVDDLLEGEPLGKSDHVSITWTYVYEDGTPERGPGPSLPHKYNYRKGRFVAMGHSLSLVDWSSLKEMSVEEAWLFFKETVTEHMKIHIPQIKPAKKTTKAAPWWSSELTKEVKRKYKAWQDYSRSRSAEDFRSYANQRNKTTAKLREARSKYENHIIYTAKKEPKKLFQYVRSQQKTKAVVGPLLDAEKLTENDHQAAEVLHTFFQSVFVHEDASSLPEFPDQVEENATLDEVTIRLEDVIEELMTLNPNKSAGPDGIPTTVLRKCAKQLALPLQIIFQKTLSTCKLPQDWKLARITPIFKKGSRRSPGNYRPVSLTSQPCKILERMIKKQLIQHVELHNIITPHQHGFVQMKSCETNLLEAFDDWTRIMDEGQNLDIIYLDFKKAFDTVPHSRLLTKLSGYGIRGKTLSWIQEFLTDRYQQVVVGAASSTWGKVTSGVPQGSVLGPTLFTLYVNDLPSQVCSSLKMFADDTKLYRRIRNPSDTQALQDDLTKLVKWSDKWLLKFNADKCTVMHCGHSNPKKVYLMKQEGEQIHELAETKIEKDLGVHVTNTLKPTTHCLRAANKAMVALKLMRMAFDRLKTSNFNQLYTTYVRPHLDFCVQAVGPYMRQDFSALEKVQRRATKLVRGLKFLPYPDRLRRLGLCSMEERVRRGDLISTFKILTGKVKLDATKFFEKARNQRTRGHHLKLKKKQVRGQARANFFSNRVITLWNKLPEEVVSAKTTNQFKSRLDRYWAEKALSSHSS